MHPDNDRPARADVAAEAAPAPKPELLVIEDDAMHRVVIGRVAGKLGYAVTEAASVSAAAGLLAARRFDCITLDLNMDGHSGTELLEVMHARQADVPVIVVSSADDGERWDVLRMATLYGIRVTEMPKPLEVGKLKAVFMELRDLA